MSVNKFNSHDSQRELSGVRILVADDCCENQYLMKLLLARKGAEVSLASDGADAYALALREDFDILLLDIQMPVMNGYETMAKLKAAKYSRPVLAVTASTKDEDREHILAAGFAARVTKPIDSKFLAQMIRTLIAPNRTQSEMQT